MPVRAWVPGSHLPGVNRFADLVQDDRAHLRPHLACGDHHVEPLRLVMPGLQLTMGVRGSVLRH